MNVSQELIKEARDSVLNLMETKREKALQRFDELLKAYVDACLLSNGRVPDRNKHWEMKAMQARLGIWKFICMNGGEIHRK